MLANLAPGTEGDIVAENIRAVQAIYFAHHLESMRAFEVVDRLVELYQQGQLPLGSGRVGSLLERYAAAAGRLSARQRQRLYAGALGVAGEAADAVPADHEFHSLWLRLITAVALLDHRQDASSLLARANGVSAVAWRDARALATKASVHGAALVGSVKQLSVIANLLRAVLQAPEIRKAFGARDMWQVIEQVAAVYLGGAHNVVRHRRLAQGGSALLEWVAEHAYALAKPVAPAPFPDPALLDAVQAWLAASDEEDDADNDTKPSDWPALASPSARLWALASELVRIMGIEALLGRRELAAAPADEAHPQGLVVLFCGAAGAGKTLGAHTLAATLSRDLMRVDLRQVLSQAIGETEKNLHAVLAQVEHSRAVLLLDEADALFGKRTDVQDAHDRYTDSEIDRLLQRLQAHKGMVILESTAVPSGSGAAGRLAAGLSHVVHFPR